QARDGRDLVVRHRVEEPEQRAAVFRREEGAEAATAQFMADQGAKPRSGEPDGIAGGRAVLEKEDVTEQSPDLRRLDIRALGSRTAVAQPVPISVQRPR